MNILGKKISRMTTKDRERENEALFVELKATAAKHHGTQKKTDDLINKTGIMTPIPKTQKIAGKELEEGPEIGEATLVRLHVNELPKDLYMATLMEGLSEKWFLRRCRRRCPGRCGRGVSSRSGCAETDQLENRYYCVIRDSRRFVADG